jgi:hypothetical protein
MILITVQKLRKSYKRVITTGNPDIVVRMSPLGLDRSVDRRNLPMMIIEVSADKSGRKKNIGQDLDYASLIPEGYETLLVLTLHLDQRKENAFKIIQEAFLYVHSKHECKQKVGFLWREIYQESQESSTLAFLTKS